MTDIKRYGSSELSGSYYFVREYAPMGGAAYVSTYFIDDLGKSTKIGATYEGWAPEEVAELPTLTEATTEHLAPAFEEAESNLKVWRERRKQEGHEPQPAPPPMDRATRRLYEDAD